MKRSGALSGKFAGMKETLKVMEEFLSDPESDYERYVPHSPLSEPEYSDEYAEYIQKSYDEGDLNERLDKEKEKSAVLEQRIRNKDELLSEMATLQNDLYANIEDLQTAQAALKVDAKRLRDAVLAQDRRIEQLQVELNAKEKELAKAPSSEEAAKLTVLLQHKEQEALQLTQQLQSFQRKTLELAGTAPLLGQLQGLLGLYEPSAIYRKVSHLATSHGNCVGARKFLDKLGNIMLEFAPEGTYSHKPTHSQIWKWLSGTLENYMELKQSLASRLSYNLEHALHVPPAEVQSTVQLLLS